MRRPVMVAKTAYHGAFRPAILTVHSHKSASRCATREFCLSANFLVENLQFSQSFIRQMLSNLLRVLGSGQQLTQAMQFRQPFIDVLFEKVRSEHRSTVGIF